MARGDGGKKLKIVREHLLDEFVKSIAGDERVAYTTTEMDEMISAYDDRLDMKSRKPTIQLLESSNYLVKLSKDGSKKGGNLYWLVPPITPKDQRVSNKTKVALYEKVESLVDSSKNLEALSEGKGSDSQSE